MEKHYLAIDLGAESGRVMLGKVGEGRVAVEEIHRFANVPVSIHGTLRWNLLQLFTEIKNGLRLAAVRGLSISGISTDAWGLDYVLFRDEEPMVALPFHYRDARTDGAMAGVFARVPAEAIFAATGIQFMSINTLFQLFLDAQDRSETLAAADRFLNIGDYFNYLLSGVPKGEASLASTTQLFDPRTGDWAWDLIDGLGLPKRIFPALVPPGTRLGALSPDIAAETGLRGVEIIASCSHDTAAAVAAVPGGKDWAFISSGTWSLLGTELSAPIINPESRRHNFTNEVGFGGTILFRKNIVGLWIVQECRRAWSAEGREFGYEELTALAEKSEPMGAWIRPEDPRFGKPGNMPGKIADFCRETGQKPPEGPGAVIRCALESLALLYAKTLGDCAEVVGAKFRVLHIVGGGSKNSLLNQLTANAARLPVLAGPVEATAIGNVLIQAKVLGQVDGDLRSLVRESYPQESFKPEAAATWLGALKRFEALPVPP